MQGVFGQQHDLRGAFAVALLDPGYVPFEHGLLLCKPEGNLDLVADGNSVEHESYRFIRLVSPVDQADFRGGHAGFRRADRNVE